MNQEGATMIFLFTWISFAAAAFVVKMAQAVRPSGPARPLFWATFIVTGVVVCAAFGPFIFFSEVLGKGGE